MARTDPREIIKAPAQHDGAADHGRHLEIRQTLVIEHAVELPEREQPERSDQGEKRELVAGKDNPQRDRPEDKRAGKTKNKNRARCRRFGCGDALERLGHPRHNPKSFRQRQAQKVLPRLPWGFELMKHAQSGKIVLGWAAQTNCHPECNRGTSHIRERSEEVVTGATFCSLARHSLRSLDWLEMTGRK